MDGFVWEISENDLNFGFKVDSGSFLFGNRDLKEYDSPTYRDLLAEKDGISKWIREGRKRLELF